MADDWREYGRRPIGHVHTDVFGALDRVRWEMGCLTITELRRPHGLRQIRGRMAAIWLLRNLGCSRPDVAHALRVTPQYVTVACTTVDGWDGPLGTEVVMALGRLRRTG